MPGDPFKFWQELKRRKVIRVTIVYAAAAYVILELVSIIAEPFGLPEWTLKLVFVLLCVGLIISIVLSWIYDITPEGVKKTKPLTKEEEPKKVTPSGTMGWKIATYSSIAVIIVLLLINIFSREKKLEELEKSIAVLPFENLSSDEEHAWFSDGITDVIINQLSKISSYRVIGRTSTLKYKEEKKSIQEIGDELGVNYIIEGTIQREGNKMRISVQLVRVLNEDHIWSELYDLEWKDIFDVQSDIAERVADELRTILTPEEIEQIQKKPTENLDAYYLYLRGRFFWNKRTAETFNTAIDYFKQAIEKDPDFALAYVGLADSYSILPFYQVYSDQESFILAEKAALKALEIDNTLAEAHNSMGWVHFSQWNFKEAETEFLQAIELNPDYATAHHWYGLLLNSKGSFDDAVKELRKALTLDPLSLVINRNLGGVLRDAGKYDMAMEFFDKVIDVDPGFPALNADLALLYLFTGEYEKAISAIHKSENKYKPLEGIIYESMELTDKAKQLYDELILQSDSVYVSPFFLALLQFSLRMDDHGFKSLKKAYEVHDLNLTFINRYNKLEVYDSSDPRFVEIINLLGVEGY